MPKQELEGKSFGEKKNSSNHRKDGEEEYLGMFTGEKKKLPRTDPSKVFSFGEYTRRNKRRRASKLEFRKSSTLFRSRGFKREGGWLISLAHPAGPGIPVHTIETNQNMKCYFRKTGENSTSADSFPPLSNQPNLHIHHQFRPSLPPISYRHTVP